MGSKKKELKKRNAAEHGSKDLNGFYKNQGAHEKKAEQQLKVTKNKWVRFNKGRQEKKRNTAETNALLEETYQNSVNKSFVNSMIMKKMMINVTGTSSTSKRKK